MRIIHDLEIWRSKHPQLKTKTIGFIPTMGNLHAGHLSLCKKAMQENDVTVVTIFVNPTQFNHEDDFVHYPRTLEQDLALLRASNIDYVLVPEHTALYKDRFEVQLQETVLSRELEGHFRPGHFTGMLTVVLKLFNLIQPTRAYFGEKDFQQLLLIKKMVKALFLPVKIIACPTIRGADGLALSSRNNRLTSTQRLKAAHFPRLLQSSDTVDVIKAELIELGFTVDYIVVRWQRRLGAVWLDHIRLIDNFALVKGTPFFNAVSTTR